MTLFKEKTIEPTRPERTTPVSAQSKHSFIGPNFRIDGEITGDEELLVEGTIEGKVDVEKDLTVGSTANLKADVRASSVLIRGTVLGNIEANKKIVIDASGSVEGDILSPKIVIEEGAHFKGNVEMKRPKQPIMEAQAKTAKQAMVKTEQTTSPS